MKRQSQFYQACWVALMCFNAGLLSSVISKNGDYWLFAIPVLFAAAILIPLYSKVKFERKIVGIIIHFISIIIMFGIVISISENNTDWLLKPWSPSILSASTGILLYAINMLVFQYKKMLVGIGILLIGLLAVPFVANQLVQIKSIQTYFSYFHIIILLWQAIFGLAIGATTTKSENLIRSNTKNKSGK